MFPFFYTHSSSVVYTSLTYVAEWCLQRIRPCNQESISSAQKVLWLFLLTVGCLTSRHLFLSFCHSDGSERQVVWREPPPGRRGTRLAPTPGRCDRLTCGQARRVRVAAVPSAGHTLPLSCWACSSSFSSASSLRCQFRPFFQEALPGTPNWLRNPPHQVPSQHWTSRGHSTPLACLLCLTCTLGQHVLSQRPALVHCWVPSAQHMVGGPE